MGRPSGLARSFRAPREKRPTAAALVAEYLRNSLLEMAGMVGSLVAGYGRTVGAHYKQIEGLPEVKRADGLGRPSLQNQESRRYKIAARMPVVGVNGRRVRRPVDPVRRRGD